MEGNEIKNRDGIDICYRNGKSKGNREGKKTADLKK